LRAWQRKFIRAIYEPHGANGRRLVRRAILSIARKNGKTALIAALVLAHLVGPERITNGEIYSAATSRDQAGQVFKVAQQIVEADAELSAMITVVPSTKTLVHPGSGSFYRAISADAGNKHGGNPSVVIYDELAQARSRDLYDVLDTSMGARAEPLFVVISTQSNDPEHILSKLIDDGLSGVDPTIVCHLYAVPEDTPDSDIFKERIWKLANPALGDFRSLEDMRAIANKAKRMPAEEPKFRNLFLNQRIAPTVALISRAEWFACAGDAAIQPGEDVYLGLDLSSVNDLTALVMVSAHDNSRVMPFFWKPLDLLREHSNRDFGTGHMRYVEWLEAGHLFATAGRSIDKEVVARFIAELWGEYRILGMAYDRWRIDDLIKEFERIGFPAHKSKDKGDGLKLIEWGQGFKDMSPAIDAFEAAVIDRKLVHPSNPVLNWNIANAVPAKPDPAGNRKIDKEKSRFRIDGAIALAMALGLKARESTTEGGGSMSDFLLNPVIV
jgi:phage terminase large subunit-like protein